MLKYLIVQLDRSSVSFCHYPQLKDERRLIDLDVLGEALLWSMKENLSVQFVYPDYNLPAEYKSLISSVDHSDIIPADCHDTKLAETADVVVFDSWHRLCESDLTEAHAYVIRTTFADLFANANSLADILPKVARLNVVITDVEGLNAEIEQKYAAFLVQLSDLVCREYDNGHSVQLNLLTDRMMLDAMNNCGAGDESITLGADGKFYICPGFYAEGLAHIGDLASSPQIKNAQLYKLGHSPICRICDAWHCRRCVWLNKKMTLEVNTPSREQCVTAHLERNASRQLLAKIRQIGTFLPDKEIPEISYLDPFDKLTQNQ